jgi:hypothetical protein
MEGRTDWTRLACCPLGELQARSIDFLPIPRLRTALDRNYTY